jgi:DNA-binding NarL/FixJ family response regulator
MVEPTRRVRVDIRCNGRAREEADELVRSFTASDNGAARVRLETNPTHPDIPLVVIGPNDDAAMLEAVEAGAMGYVIHSTGQETFRDAVLAVARGEAVIPPMMLGTLLRHIVRQREAADAHHLRLDLLTAREKEVVLQLTRGKHRRDIAKELSISPETVRTHIQRAMAKLGVHSQTELVALLAPHVRGES